MKFLDPLELRWAGPDDWIVLSEIRCLSAAGDVIYIPAGWHTDGASIPRLFRPVYSPWGPWAHAAVLHDWLYLRRGDIGHRIYTRKEADDLFLEGMLSTGCDPETSLQFWRTVRHFGKGQWDDDD